MAHTAQIWIRPEPDAPMGIRKERGEKERREGKRESKKNGRDNQREVENER